MYDYAAFNCICDLAFENCFVFCCFNNFEPIFLCVNFLFGKHCDTVEVAYSNSNCFNLVANFKQVFKLGCGIVCYVFECKNTCNFGTDINVYFSIGYGCNDAGHFISCI